MHASAEILEECQILPVICSRCRTVILFGESVMKGSSVVQVGHLWSDKGSPGLIVQAKDQQKQDDCRLH